jgi:type IV secretory pathway VirB10-like protein
MTARQNRVAALALFAAVAFCSCQRKKPPLPVMVPPAVTVRVPEKASPPPPPPPDLPPSTNSTTVAPPPAVTETKMPGPPKKRRRSTAKNQKAEPAQSLEAQAPVAAGSTPATQESTAAPVPRLGQMLSDSQRRDYEVRIHDALERARANLGKARSNPRLGEAQQRMAAQVETFVNQAEERRKTDLVSSRSLAERADLLSRDLLESLH